MNGPRRALLSLLLTAAAFALLTGDAAARQRRAQGDDPQASRLVAEGQAALERDDRVAARDLFRRALQRDARNVTAHTYLGILADQSGELAEAERHFAAAAEAAPQLPSARNNYGAILLRLGQAARAAAEFEASLKLDPAQPSALVNLAQIKYAAGTPEGLRAAFDLFARAHAAAPDAEIARALVVAALRLGQREAAARYYRDYAATKPNPTSGIKAPAARAELGAALLEAGLAEQAVWELVFAVTDEPAKPEWVVLLARAHLAKKDVRAAGTVLEMAVQQGVNAGMIYAMLAEVYVAAGHVENAIPAMRLAIEREPANESYRFRYGMLLTDTGAPQAAVIRLQEALEKFPRSSRLLFALGVAHFVDRKLLDAVAAFRRAAEADPSFAPALAYLAMTYAEQGQYTEAVPLYERALAADDRLAAAHFLLADSLVKQAPSDPARAERHLARAVALEPSFAPARLALAKLLFNTDRVQEAARELERAVADEPKLAEAYYQLGRVYQRLRRTAESQTAFNQFKRLSDSQQQAAEAGRRDVARRLANVRF